MFQTEYYIRERTIYTFVPAQSLEFIHFFFIYFNNAYTMRCNNKSF